ncbi:MAG TPA: hypothetical protein VN980_19645, partial [Alphaproteobacteria bacterium]|nr:hypothetical protein [Alphaproteobacteria bacterium]
MRAFDRACLDALVEFHSSMLSLDRALSDVSLSRLVSLVNIVRRMKPRQTVIDLHQNYVRWNAFFENFVIDRGLDLRREFWRILAITQEQAEEAGLAHRRLMPLWLSICGESGGSGLYDESYLRVALLGLRGLPLGQRFSSNEDFALHGLARWAAARNPTKAAFLREWRVLEGDFPRQADFWPPRVEAAVAAMEQEISERSSHQRKTFSAASWWREDVAVGTVPRRRRDPIIEPPPRENREEVLRRVGDSFATIEGMIDRLMADHQRYADSTGDVFYLVRTACNVGMRLIERGPATEHTTRGETAVQLARLAFDYDPTNVHAWALLRDALGFAGRVDDAELVGWEAMRRFPEDPQWRTQLATLMTDSLGRPEDAATLLRESVSLFPENAYARTQLAMILADELNQRDEAETVLVAARQDGVANEVTESLLLKLHKGRKLGGAARVHTNAAVSGVHVRPRLELPTAIARRDLFRFENGLTDISSVRDLLKQQAPDAYLAYVGARTGAQPIPLKTTFALAFEAAARDGSVVGLRALAARARPLEGVLIGQAIAALESRIELPALNDNDVGGTERVIHLTRQFGGIHAPPKAQRLVLLRDLAASFLSTDVLRLAA